jgi:hypothetical protein
MTCTLAMMLRLMSVCVRCDPVALMAVGDATFEERGKRAVREDYTRERGSDAEFTPRHSLNIGIAKNHGQVGIVAQTTFWIARMNRDTVVNVLRAGFEIDRESNVYIDVMKAIEARWPVLNGG